MKRIYIVIASIIIIILLFPIRTTYKDGGTKSYNSILYRIIIWNELNDTYDSGYRTGTEIQLFPKNFKNIDNYRKDGTKYKSFNYKGYFFESNIVKKISSKEDFNKIFNKENYLSEEIINKLKEYDDDYFINKDLILIYFPLSNGGITAELKEIKNNDKIEIIFYKTTSSGTSTAVMQGYLYGIEINKTNKHIEAKFINLETIEKEY